MIKKRHLLDSNSQHHLRNPSPAPLKHGLIRKMALGHRHIIGPPDSKRHIMTPNETVMFVGIVWLLVICVYLLS